MQQRPALLGMLASAIVGCSAAAALIFLDHPLSPRGVQAALRVRVEQRLRDVGLDNVHVRMRGQTAVLSGQVATPALASRAEQAALTAAGPGGPWLGGVARVVSTLQVGGAAPAGWVAKRNAAGVWIEGPASDPAAKQAVYARAVALQMGAVQDASWVGDDPRPPGWAILATAALHQLARLRSGEVRIVGDRLFLMGVGDAAAVAAAQQWAAAEPPRPFQVSTDVRVAADGALDWRASPEGCAVALPASAQALPPLFAGPALRAGGAASLEPLAAILRRCDHLPWRLSARGRDAAEAELRAKAVVQVLLADGVEKRTLQIAPAAASLSQELAIELQPGSMQGDKGSR